MTRMLPLSQPDSKPALTLRSPYATPAIAQEEEMPHHATPRVMATTALALIPLALTVPAHAASPALALKGTGAQVYVCAAADSGFAWRLKAPDATLVDGKGHTFAHHFAGPSWQAMDGSLVVGDVLVASPAPKPGAIPWLVLQAKFHSGNGVFTPVGFIVRSNTKGGVAPATGCDRAREGAETRVRYTALYTFFPEP